MGVIVVVEAQKYFGQGVIFDYCFRQKDENSSTEPEKFFEALDSEPKKLFEDNGFVRYYSVSESFMLSHGWEVKESRYPYSSPLASDGWMSRRGWLECGGIKACKASIPPFSKGYYVEETHYLPYRKEVIILTEESQHYKAAMNREKILYFKDFTDGVHEVLNYHFLIRNGEVIDHFIEDSTEQDFERVDENLSLKEGRIVCVYFVEEDHESQNLWQEKVSPI